MVHNDGPQRDCDGIRAIPAAAAAYLVLPLPLAGRAWDLQAVRRDYREPADRRLPPRAASRPRLAGNGTANKHIVNLQQYWDYSVRIGKITAGFANPFHGHLIKRPQGRAARAVHAMWPAEEDRKLFSSALVTGCKSIYRRVMPGDEIHRDVLLWVAFVGRTMGLREDEAYDRRVGDIQFVETETGLLPYMQIRDSKTPSSDRDIPIRFCLLELGVLEYRFYGRDPDEPLFPELIP